MITLLHHFCCSRGVLREIRNEGPDDDLIVIVDFPEHRGWKALYSELELVEGCGLEVRH